MRWRGENIRVIICRRVHPVSAIARVCMCIIIYTGGGAGATGPTGRAGGDVGRRLCDLLAGTLIKGARCETPRPRARSCVCVQFAYTRPANTHTSVNV